MVIDSVRRMAMHLDSPTDWNWAHLMVSLKESCWAKNLETQTGHPMGIHLVVRLDWLMGMRMGYPMGIHLVVRLDWLMGMRMGYQMG